MPSSAHNSEESINLYERKVEAHVGFEPTTLRLTAACSTY